MKRIEFLAGRLREVLLNGYWIANTNYREQLSLVTYSQAVRRVDNLNSIAALIFHVNYYLEGLIAVFETGKLNMSDKDSYLLPVLDGSDDWNQLINRLLTNSELLAVKIECKNDDFLDSAFVDEKYGTWQRNLEGVIEHCYYHLGQVVLIRKLISN